MFDGLYFAEKAMALVACALTAHACLKTGKKPRKPLHKVKPQQSRQLKAFVEACRRLVAPDEDGAAVAAFPKKFELHGHVVVVSVPAERVDSFKKYAEAFAESFKPIVVDVVVCDTGGIEGELRIPVHSVLWQGKSATSFGGPLVKKLEKRRIPEARTFAAIGSSPTFTTHVENGFTYAFDVLKVMFCSGNTTERMHFATISAENETVVDMFAGIGYFTVPLAARGRIKKLFAVEKNSESAQFLRLNCALNGISHTVEVACGDNREMCDDLIGQCDRVMMGYIPSCQSFLARAVQFLKVSPDGTPCGTIHYHLLAAKGEAASVVAAHLQLELGSKVADLACIAAVRMVKSFSPKKYHFVADVVF